MKDMANSTEELKTGRLGRKHALAPTLVGGAVDCLFAE
jgi:hypothetical protein